MTFLNYFDIWKRKTRLALISHLKRFEISLKNSWRAISKVPLKLRKNRDPTQNCV